MNKGAIVIDNSGNTSQPVETKSDSSINHQLSQESNITIIGGAELIENSKNITTAKFSSKKISKTEKKRKIFSQKFFIKKEIKIIHSRKSNSNIWNNYTNGLFKTISFLFTGNVSSTLIDFNKNKIYMVTNFIELFLLLISLLLLFFFKKYNFSIALFEKKFTRPPPKIDVLSHY